MEFIPFVPYKSHAFENDLYAVAVEAWCSQLGNVLDAPEDEFLVALRENENLHAFVSAVLDTQLSDRNVAPEVLRRVFLVFVRAGQIHATSPLFSVDRLSSFAVTFGKTNPAIVQLVFSQLFSADRALADAMRSFVPALVDCLAALLSSSAAASPPPAGRTSTVRLFVLVQLLEALTWAAAEVVVVLEQQQRILSVLFACYSVLDHVVDDPKERCQIKRTLVATWDHVFEYTYFQPIENRPDTSVIDGLSECMLGWIEKSDIETSKRAFADAPIIMDWQAESNDHLTDDERLEFLKLSMEQVRDMTVGASMSCKKPRQRRTKPTAKPNLSSTEDVARISQIRDLFPDLGDGFIKACLLEYNNDVETAVMRLLEDTLPPNLQKLDRSLAELPQVATASSEIIPERPETSILDSRRNIFDNDEFDLLSGKAKWDRTKMHMGKIDRGTAETLLSDKSFMEEQKANVLQRIYDMYDDEYDDTYDGINESSGPVDIQAVEEEDDAAADIVKGKKKAAIVEDPGLLYESDLVHAFVEQRDVLGRTSAARKSPARAALRKKTGMSDEQIEGWAIMFDRNPRKQRILDKYMLLEIRQEDIDVKALKEEQQKKRQEQQAADQDDSKQRAYKAKNKARFGNHNRKRGHDKKMQKAGHGSG
ncbi:hypothetical protein BX666DRAFT_2028453 [Dichotomocladium elegans]|nr:hypothetical protein BX666DRAFT_2028453 [Dichotomocladium elegans]